MPIASVVLAAGRGSRMKAFSGKLVVLVRSSETPGDIKLEVTGKGLKPAVLALSSE